MRLLYIMPEGLAVIFIPIILGMIIVSLAQSYRDALESKHWIDGESWERTDINNNWVVAKMKADYDCNEIMVKFNPLDGFFYDKDNRTYFPYEIQIKIDG